MATFNDNESGLSVRTKINNVLQHADGTASELVINDAGADVNFRVESDTVPNALFVDGGTGNVGIGTSAPSYKLDIASSTVDDATAALRVSRGGVSTNWSRIDNISGVLNFRQYDSSSPIIRWLTSTDGSTWSERMRITSTGSVGIGTTAAAGFAGNASFTVSNAAASAFANIESPVGSGALQFYRAGVHHWLLMAGLGSTDNLSFRQGSTERMRIDSSGNVGIGTTTPAEILELAEPVDGVALRISSRQNDSSHSTVDPFGAVEFYSQDGSGPGASVRARIGAQFLDASGATSGLTFSTSPSTGLAEVMRITQLGYVGIGTTAPTANMHVVLSGTAVTADAGTSAIFQANGTTGTGTNVAIITGNASVGSLDFGDEDNQDVGSVQYNHASNSMQFFTAALERMRIDSSGTLLVGKTTTGVGVVGHQIQANGLAQHVSDGAGPLQLNRLTSDGTIAEFRKDSVVVGTIAVTASATAYNTSSDYRLKEDVQPLTGASDRVLALNPVNFAWKATGTRTDGFIAHEAQAVAPYAVMGEKDGEEMQQIDQSKLVPLLTAALQEALQRIAALEAQLKP